MVMRLTLSFRTSFVDSSACDKNIMNNRKDTLAADPCSVLVFDLTVIQNSRLVKVNASPMNFSSERDLIRMKVLPT